MSQHGKIPATVITGFLGAGKTSMIRHLLQTAQGKRLAVDGERVWRPAGVDGDILKSCADRKLRRAENIMELANGCICCTVADDFIPTIETDDWTCRSQPDHIVIETSGLALPKPLIKAFNWPDVRNRVTVDGVIVVVDAPAVAEGRFAADPEALQAQREADEALDHESPLEELFEEQLGSADLIVLNKTDLLPADAMGAVRDEVAPHLRPEVKLLQARHGGIEAGVLLGLAAAAEDDLDSRPSHHDDGEEHDHDDFASFALELGELADPAVLLARLKDLVAEHDIFRVKGFAAVAGKGMRLVVQGVGGRFQSYYDRDWAPTEPRATRLVFIGRADLDQAGIAAALES